MSDDNKKLLTYVPSDKDRKAIKMVMNDWKAYTQSTRTLRDRFETAYRNYMQDHEHSQRGRDGLANVNVPVTRWIVDSLVPMILGQNPTIDVDPVDLEDVVKADFLSRILKIQWEKQMNMFRKLQPYALGAVLFGTAVMKFSWDDDKDAPRATPVNIRDFFVDPFAESIEEAHSVIHRSFVPISTLTPERGYVNQKFLVPKERLDFQAGEDEENSDALAAVTLDSTTLKTSSELVEVLEWHSNERVVTVAMPESGDPVLVRDIENPYEHGKKPFVEFVVNPDPLGNRFFGEGVGLTMIDIQESVNTMANQVIDNNNLSIMSMMTVRRSSGLNVSHLAPKPGRIIPVNEHDDVRPIQIPNMTVPAQNMMNRLFEFAQQMTGSADLVRGLGPSDTATGTAIRDKNVGTRINIMLRGLEESIGRMADMVARMDMQYITKKQVGRFDVREITDEELKALNQGGIPTDIRRGKVFFEFDRNAIKGDFDIEARVDSTVSKDSAVMARRLNEVLSIASGLPESNLNIEELVRRILEKHGINDTKNLFKEELPPEPAPLPEIPAGPALGPENAPAPGPLGPAGPTTDAGAAQSQGADILGSLL